VSEAGPVNEAVLPENSFAWKIAVLIDDAHASSFGIR
jgi:hypothetical protein